MSLTPRQRAALAALADGGEHTPTRLAAAIGTHENGAARTASSLVRRGHVARYRARHGRRSYVVYRITAQGLAQVRYQQTAFV